MLSILSRAAAFLTRSRAAASHRRAHKVLSSHISRRAGTSCAVPVQRLCTHGCPWGCKVGGWTWRRRHLHRKAPTGESIHRRGGIQLECRTRSGLARACDARWCACSARLLHGRCRAATVTCPSTAAGIVEWARPSSPSPLALPTSASLRSPSAPPVAHRDGRAEDGTRAASKPTPAKQTGLFPHVQGPARCDVSHGAAQHAYTRVYRDVDLTWPRRAVNCRAPRAGVRAVPTRRPSPYPWTNMFGRQSRL